MKKVLTALAACLLMGAAHGGQVQESSAPGLPRMTQLADGVFAYEQLDPTKKGVTANNLIVVTSEGVLVADGQGTVENTRKLLADIAKVTSQPVRYVVVGSEHGDHRGGDAAFETATFFASPFSRDNLERQAKSPHRRPNAPKIIVPTETVSDKRVLNLGGREIDLLFLGRAHTGGDLEVYLPRERVMFMSEVFSNRIFPSMANSYPSEWVAALKRAEQMAAGSPITLVPAHGLPDLKVVLPGSEPLYRQALERVIAEGRRLHDLEIPPDEAVSQADFGEFGGWWRKDENAPSALKRVYQELDKALPQ